MGAGAALMLKTPLSSLDSGEIAHQALGLSGAVCVIVSGWATSNPTLYRAGLALQVVTPGWPRWLVTLLAGIATVTIARFPYIFQYLLEYAGMVVHIERLDSRFDELLLAKDSFEVLEDLLVALEGFWVCLVSGPGRDRGTCPSLLRLK